jgi:hypothetical protein
VSDLSKRLLHELLKFRRADPASTEVFMHWKHDSDLLPRFRDQVEAAFSAFHKYQRNTYEIQGFRDEGTDILLKEKVSDEEQNSFFCFQIKSEWDLQQPDYLQTLKSQFFDTQRRYRTELQEYFIILCVSVVVEEKKRKHRDAQPIHHRWIDDRTKRTKLGK